MNFHVITLVRFCKRFGRSPQRKSRRQSSLQELWC